jgi:hypothetical protein
MNVHLRTTGFWACAALLVWTLDRALTPLIFGPALNLVSAPARLAALLCAGVLAWVLLGIAGFGPAALAPDLLAPDPLGAWVRLRSLWSRPRVRLALVAGVTGVAALAICFALSLDGVSQEARWIKVAVDTPASAAPPLLRVRFGAGPGDAAVVRWQPYARTAVSIVPGTEPLLLTGVTTDEGPVDLATMKLTGTPARGEAGLVIAAPGGILVWPKTARRVTLTFAAGAGDGLVSWLDREARLAPAAATRDVTLSLPSRWQGWALLPRQEIRTLAIESPGRNRPFTPVLAEMTAPEAQTWDPRRDPHAWNATGCDAAPEAGAQALRASSGARCVIGLAPVHQINARSLLGTAWRTLLLWGALFGAVALVLRGWPWIARLRWLAWIDPAGAAPAGAGRAALAVWVVASIWHLSYAVAVPGMVGGDVANYLSLGMDFTRLFDFSPFTFRTPGYPMLAGALMRLFGDNLLPLVLANHLLLSLLAPLAVRALAPVVPLAVAIAAGVVVGLTPGLSVAAQGPLTEALSAALVLAALLLTPGAARSWRMGLGVGLLLGLGVLVRPGNAVAVPLVLLWLAARAAWHAAHARLMPALVAAPLAIVLGYAAAAAPWHTYLAAVQKTLDPSGGHAGFTLWGTEVCQRLLTADQPLNAPDRALWTVRTAWNYDPFALLVNYPWLYTNDMHPVDRYHQEAAQEARDRAPAEVVRLARVTLGYMLSFEWRPEDRLRLFPELQATLNTWRAGGTIGAGQYGDMGPRLTAMAGRWNPPESPVRKRLLEASQHVFNTWQWVAPFALIAGALVAVSRAGYPGFGLLWMYLAASLALASLGMAPADRYVMVLEPIVDLLAIVSGAALLRGMGRAVRTVAGGRFR